MDGVSDCAELKESLLESMVEPSHLTAFQGAPFDPELVEIAEASVRSEAGWHIAPIITETFRFASWRHHSLLIPSGRVLSVNAVRVDGVPLTDGWVLQPDGLLRRTGWWWQSGVVEVDVTHGYETVPPDLLPVIASRAASYRTDRTVSRRQQVMGPYQENVTYRDGGDSSESAVLRYSIAAVVA